MLRASQSGTSRLSLLTDDVRPSLLGEDQSFSVNTSQQSSNYLLQWKGKKLGPVVEMKHRPSGDIALSVLPNGFVSRLFVQFSNSRCLIGFNMHSENDGKASSTYAYRSHV